MSNNAISSVSPGVETSQLPNAPLWPTTRFMVRRYRPGNLGTWSAHLPFANDLVAALRPSMLVELGTHYGESYFGFCQAVDENRVSCKCYAVDTWQGDPHSGRYDESVYNEVKQYNIEHYSHFSILLRETFDTASTQFSNGSIDLLHIDGLHTYEAVKHDFLTWLPKLRPGAIVLFHDTMARHAGFGVWQLWEEMCDEYDHFEFLHGWGLGVLRIPGGARPLGLLRALFSGDDVEHSLLRHYYEVQGENLDLRHRQRLSSQASPALLTIYPCLQNGYTEAGSVSAGLTPDLWERHSLHLPQGSGAGPIRLVPADRICVIELRQITVRRASDAATLGNWTGSASEIRTGNNIMRVPGQTTGRFLATGFDPQLYLPTLPPEVSDQPLVVEVWMRLLSDLGSIGMLLTAVVSNDSQISRAAFAESRNQITAITHERELLCAELTEARAEVRSHQAERLALLAEQRYQALMHRELQQKQRMDLCEIEDLVGRLKKEQAQRLELESRCAAERLDLQSRFESERHARAALLDSYSWRITAPLRRLYEMANSVMPRKK